MNKLVVIFVALTLASCGGVKTKPSPLKYNVLSKKSLALEDIPQSCRNKNKSYHLVDTIFSKASYNDKATKYKPIHTPKGFIANDFNKDKKLDFLFLERLDSDAGSDITLITCFSTKKQYLRKVTLFKVHEVTGVDFQTISENIDQVGDGLVLSVNRHEHNWGSDSDVTTYSFDQSKNEFILKQREISSNSGDGMRSDTYESYDLVKRRYTRTNTCGWAEEGCKPSKARGKFIAQDAHFTLGASSKLYKKLIPDK